MKPICQMNITECFFQFFVFLRCAENSSFFAQLCQTSEKNKMGNSQNGYSRVKKTGKIKKSTTSQIRYVYTWAKNQLETLKV